MPDTAGEWLRQILPQIRAVYEGQIVTAEHPYIGRWEVLDQHQAFEGYDGIGMTIFPWKRYTDGTHDIRTFEDLVADVRERSRIINFLGDKYGIEWRFVATLGMDFWQGGEPDPITRAQGYGLALDVLAQAGLTGVFLHLWASEPDHLGVSTAVEGHANVPMASQRVAYAADAGCPCGARISYLSPADDDRLPLKQLHRDVDQ